MPRFPLTQAAVDKGCKAPETGRIEYWDTLLPGFGLRVSAGGALNANRTWQVLYRVNGKQVREKLGTVATIPKVADARDLARVSMLKAKSGIDPVAQRRQKREAAERHAAEEAARERNTLAAAVDRYVAYMKTAGKRPEYVYETACALKAAVVPTLGSRPIPEITRREVSELVHAIRSKGKPSQANHVLSYLRAMMSWAVDPAYLIKTNPLIGVKLPAPLIQRDRALDSDEIRLFWSACNKLGWPFGPLFQLLLLTAQRRDEVAGLRWSELDLDKRTWTLPRERAKNNKAHIVHLSDAALEIIKALPKIDDRLVFTARGSGQPVSGFSHAKARLDKIMAKLSAEMDAETIPPFTLHDLRRTAATGMAAINIPHHVLDKVLNHTTGKISGVGAIYNRFDYLDERRTALDAWAHHVERLIGRAGGDNVVQLRA